MNETQNYFKRFFSFIRHQIKQIAKGGLSVLFSKIYIFTFLAPSLLIILVLRILRPVVMIRFGPLSSDRICQFAIDTELYLCERDVGMHNSRTVDFFFTPYRFVTNS